MPMYGYICTACGNKHDAFKLLKNHDEAEYCPDCGKGCRRDYSQAPAYHDVAFDSVDYDLTGEPIPYSTRGQLKEIAKRHGCRVEFGTTRSHGHTPLMR